MAIDDSRPSPSDPREALKAIKGIGPTFAAALNKMGVTTLADLASYTPEELSRALSEQAGVRVTPERIAGEDWIGQAQRLAAQGLESRQVSGEAHAATGEESEEDAGQAAWRQRAGFSLFFDYITDDQGGAAWQTRVYHDESGEDAQFIGTEPAAWINWVLARAQLSGVDAREVEKPGSGAPEAPEAPEHMVQPLGEADWTVMDTLVDIVDVHVTGVDDPAVAGGKRLMAEIRFEVVGTAAAALSAERAAYRVEVRAIDLETGEPAYVKASVDNLQPDALENAARLELPLPELGRYELHSIVHLLPPVDVHAFYEGPTVRIVAE